MKKSFLSYLGGKSQLSRQIIPLIPDHHCYCEVFAGAAWVFFKKPESNVEIINDINSDLTTLYRVVKLHLEEFIRHLKWLLVARDEFDRFMVENPESLTDIQRAVRFLYLLRTGYGARVTKPTMSISPSRPSNFNLLRIEEDLSAAHLRLSRVYIENRHYSYMLEHYDRPDTFFYIDPPYWNCEDYYGKGIFNKEDFLKLRDLLLNVKGKFILSLNDVPEVREIFKDFIIKPVNLTYSVCSKEKKSANELFIMNYQPIEK